MIMVSRQSRVAAMLVALSLPIGLSGASAQTAADCAKLSDARLKDDCVRSLSPSPRTTPAVPATPAVPGKSDGPTAPATKATPAVPSGGKPTGGKP